MDEGVPVRVEVEAPTECATAESFVARVRARTARARAAREDDEGPTYRLSVVSANGRVNGILVADGGEPRTLSGTSCNEVVEALAITVALAIDAESPEPVDFPSTRPAASTNPAAPAPVSRTREAAGAETLSTVWSAGAGVEASVTSMGALALLPTPALFAELGPHATPLLTPRFRASVATFAGDLNPGDGRAEFRWWVGRLDGCPLQVRITERLVGRPCIGAEIGALSAKGLGISQASSSQSAWLAARGLATVAWSAVGNLSFTANVGFSVPITRERFLFAPSEVVFTAPALAPFAGIAAAVTFP